MQTAFFLGANSKSGFFSRYDALIDENDARRVFILKGSPGCGKSSFMRRVEQAAINAGYDTEEIICSSDPSSLDGVIIPELGVALADGTSPHVIEPKYPLAVERYLDLSVYGDADSISEKRESVKALFKKYKSFYTRAYRLTGCAGALASEILDIALSAVSTEKLRKKAHGIISREIKGTGENGKEIPRFLSSISPNGYVTLFGTVAALAKNVYAMEDSCGLASFILHPIREAALASGKKVICCYSPLIPERLEHVIIPELSLAFITTNKLSPYPYDYTHHMRIDAMLDKEIMKVKKQKFSFTKKLYLALIDEACATLKDAKSAHDELEKEYNPHIDFDAVFNLAEKITKEILG